MGYCDQGSLPGPLMKGFHGLIRVFPVQGSGRFVRQRIFAGCMQARISRSAWPVLPRVSLRKPKETVPHRRRMPALPAVVPLPRTRGSFLRILPSALFFLPFSFRTFSCRIFLRRISPCRISPNTRSSVPLPHIPLPNRFFSDIPIFDGPAHPYVFCRRDLKELILLGRYGNAFPPLLKGKARRIAAVNADLRALILTGQPRNPVQQSALSGTFFPITATCSPSRISMRRRPSPSVFHPLSLPLTHHRKSPPRPFDNPALPFLSAARRMSACASTASALRAYRTERRPPVLKAPGAEVNARIRVRSSAAFPAAD